MVGKHSNVTARKEGSGLARVACGLLFAVDGLLVTALSLGALVLTSTYTVARGVIDTESVVIKSALSPDLFVVLFIPVLIALAMVALGFCAWRLSRTLKLWQLCALVAAVSLVVQGVWIASLNMQGAYPYADSLQLDRLARALIAGDAPAFSSAVDAVAPYLELYPFQSGSVLFLALAYAVFGAGNQVAVMAINALANSVSLLALLVIAHFLFDDKRPGCSNVCALLLCACFPVFLSCPFVYGNSAGLGLGLAALACSVAAFARPRPLSALIALGACSAVLMACSLVVKSTFILLLMGLVIAWLLFAVGRRRYVALPVILVAALAVNAVPGLATRATESAVGADFGDGMPKTSWIAMGLRSDSVSGVPGWWSFVPSDYYLQTNGNAEAQSALAVESIVGSLQGFACDPASAWSFFKDKLSSEWLDPTYQSLYYSALANAGESQITDIMYSGTSANRIAVECMDAYQLVVYAAAAAALLSFVVELRKSTLSASALPGHALMCFSFFAGFGCYLLWEAKSVYTLPFFLLLTPYASYALARLFARLEAMGRTRGL